VATASNGDYLIRVTDKGECVLMVKDSETEKSIRSYTMKLDPGGKGWIFGTRIFPSVRKVVQILLHRGMTSNNKVIHLGEPAAGAVVRADPGPSQPGTPAGGVDSQQDDEGCTVM